MADTQKIIVVDTDKSALKTVYTQAITDLQGFQAKTTWTNAEAVAAIKRLSEIQEKVLKFMARQING